MSAIWGIVSRSGMDIRPLFIKMTGETEKYRIDRTEHIKQERVAFACGHQYITREAHNDISPVYDEKTGVLFTADVFLTNRDNLINELKEICGNTEIKGTEGDAQLCFLAYKTFGALFVQKLRGAFAIALYKFDENELVLYSDHFAKRYLAYHIDEDYICFSSTYAPIKSCLSKPVRLNERCLSEYYMNLDPKAFKSDDLTVYEDICHVNPCQMLRINVVSGKKIKNTYFRFGTNIHRLDPKDDEGCRVDFLSTYRNTVKGMLRSDGETGIMLSGGLDSASVAALAAEELSKVGKKLLSYTMLPSSDFPYQNNDLITQNERPNVEAQKELHPNLETHYLTGDDGCMFTRLQELTSVFETPVKPANLENIVRMMQAAGNDGCKLMLGGKNGNASVSYGLIPNLVGYHLMHFRLISAYKAMASFCKAVQAPRKRFIRLFLSNVLDHYRSILHYQVKGPVRKELVHKYHLKRIGKKAIRSVGSEAFTTKRQRLSFIADRFFEQIGGLYDTYMSMSTGVLYIDPTEDVEMVEFCLNIPLECQVKGGDDRRTIRVYMNDCLPKCVTSKQIGRGRQGADMAFRVKREWKSVKEAILSQLGAKDISLYFEKEKIDKLIELVQKPEIPQNDLDLITLYVVCTLGAFLLWEEQ